jgi:hypothetical protein
MGADAKAINTEDIAVEAAKIDPGAFAWARHPGQIDLDHVRMALVSARRKEHGVLITGSKEKGWMLTAAGVKRAGELEARLNGGARPSNDRRQAEADAARSAERSRLLTSAAFRKWKEGHKDAIDRLDFFEYARVDEYADKERVAQKLLRLENFFGDDSQLGPFVAHMSVVSGSLTG